MQFLRNEKKRSKSSWVVSVDEKVLLLPTIFFLFFFFAILSFYSLHFVFFLSSHSVFFFTHPFWVFLLLTFFFSFFTYINFNKNILMSLPSFFFWWKMSLPSVSSNRDTIVNLYNFFFYSLIFILNQIKEFYIFLFFHPYPNTLKKN